MPFGLPVSMVCWGLAKWLANKPADTLAGYSCVTVMLGTSRCSRQMCLHQNNNSFASPTRPSVQECPLLFSNRPFEVKHFQTIHHCSVDVAHGLALLFGIGTKALPLWDSRTRRNNLWVGLAVTPTAGPSGHTNSPHPSSREGHLSTAWWNSSILLYSPIVIDPAWLLCRRDLPGPTELS